MHMNARHAKEKHIQRARRHRRVRAKISGSAARPRLAVFVSNRQVYAQLIDDERGATLAFSSSLTMDKRPMREQARLVGAQIAKKAGEKKIKAVVFDRGAAHYGGGVKEVAEAARAGGLSF